MTTLPTRKLGNLTVTSMGFGCMNLSHAYGRAVSKEQGTAVLTRALELGITHFDTAALYGFGANEQLVGEVLAPHRHEFTLASKCGMYGVQVDGAFQRVIDGRPETLAINCENSLRHLRTDRIDLYYLHRWDRQVPIEDSVGAMARLVKAGKVGQIGLSEVSAETLMRAHAVHPIAAVQSEYSIMTRNPEIAVTEACRRIGAALVAFSPVARGALGVEPMDVDALDAKDVRRSMPRFTKANYAANRKALQPFFLLARELDFTPSQLALVWLLHRAPHILPIPGTTRLQHLADNTAAASLPISSDVLQRLNRIVESFQAVGPRYNNSSQLEVDTEQWPDEVPAA